MPRAARCTPRPNAAKTIPRAASTARSDPSASRATASHDPRAGVAQARPHRTRRHTDPAWGDLQLFPSRRGSRASPPRWNSRNAIIPWRIWCTISPTCAPGHRFTPEGDNPARRTARRHLRAGVHARADHPGYLEMGVPPDYGDGAAEAVRDMIEQPGNRQRLLNDLLRPGDLERVLTEWRSLLVARRGRAGSSVGPLAGVPGGSRGGTWPASGAVGVADVPATERRAAAAVSAPAEVVRQKA